MKVLSILFTTVFLTLVSLTFAPAAHAVCPVCTVAVGVGLGVSRYFGIDDAIVGVWVGGMVLSVSFWTVDWLTKHNKNFRYRTPVTILFWYALTLIPLWYAKMIGANPLNTIYGIDKLLFGTILGSIAFLFGMWADQYQRQKYEKQFFDFQKVVFPVSALILASGGIYVLVS